VNKKKENCHYVTQSITKPWEHTTVHRARELRFYSFQDNKIEFDSSKKLLAKHKLLTDDQEDRFSELIERPIGIFKTKYLKSNIINDYNIFRALFLYFMFQVERFNLVIQKEGKGFSLEDLLNMKEVELNTISEEMRSKFIVVAMDAVDGHVIFFPEVGFYSFPIINSSTGTAVNALALPISPKRTVCLVPVGPSESDIQTSRNVMMHFSVGLNDNYDKVLVPQEIEHYSDDDIIKEIKDYRSKAILHQRQCNDMNFLVQLMYASAGVNFNDVEKLESKENKDTSEEN
jgi:hypothetical protein